MQYNFQIILDLFSWRVWIYKHQLLLARNHGILLLPSKEKILWKKPPCLYICFFALVVFLDVSSLKPILVLVNPVNRGNCFFIFLSKYSSFLMLILVTVTASLYQFFCQEGCRYPHIYFSVEHKHVFVCKLKLHLG